jgi:hypothetical protein
VGATLGSNVMHVKLGQEKGREMEIFSVTVSKMEIWRNEGKTF